MPIYEFSCKSCSHNFDGIYPVGIKAETLECPKCKQKTVKKLFSTFAVSSKGANSFEGGGHSHSSGSKCGSCGGGSCGTCH